MRTNIKKIFAVLLTVALVATMFVMPANAATTVGEFYSESILNGDFELGTEGLAPYGWSFLPSTNAARLNAGQNSWYLDGSWSLETVVENGNKVAKMSKKGAGYYYMGSQPSNVIGGKDYYISFDYKLSDIDIPEGMAFTDQYMGIIVGIRQYNANGELLNESGAVYDESSTTVTAAEFIHRIYTSARADGIGAEGEDDNYKNVTTKFTAAANATTVELYIGTGAYNAKYYFSVSFDNVNLALKDASVAGVSNVYKGYNGNFISSVANTYDLFNGDFEKITYDADGGRVANVAGPAGWFSVGANQGCTGLVSTHSNEGSKSYQVVTETEVDANGKVNTYAVFSLKHSYMSSTQNGTNLIGKNTGDTKYYNYIHSNMIKIPVAAGQTFTIKFKLKTKTADGSDTIVHGTQATPTFAVMMFKADGTSTTVDNNTRFRSNINVAPGDWQEYTLTVKAPAASYGAVYYTVGISQNVARAQGISAAAVNALYCIDDITVTYPALAETEASRYEKLGITETQTEKSGYPGTSTGNLPHLELKQTGKNSVVITAPESYKQNGTNAYGYFVYWTGEKIPVTAGDTLRVSFYNKLDGVAECYEISQQAAMVEKPAIALRYYDASGNLILATSNGTILTAAGNVAAVTGYANNTDYEWQHSTGTVVAPAGAVSVQYGYFIRLYNRAGSYHIENHFSDVTVKSSSDAYWTSAEYELLKSDNHFDTNLFDSIILANGNDLVADDLAALTNLVKMNNTMTATNKAPYQSSTEAAFDMNQDGRITEDDIVYYRWKLLGITDESKAVK